MIPGTRLPAWTAQSSAGDGVPEPWRSLTWSRGDGESLTISHLGAWLYEAFFLPGDSLLWLVMTHAPAVARFFELDAAYFGGVLSGFISALAWLSLLLLAGVLYNAAREADRALTRWIINFYGGGVRRVRVMLVSLKARWHQRPRPLRRRGRAGFSAGVQEVALDAREMRVLDLHAELAPGYALATSEVAAALGVSAGEAERTLGKLSRLRLLAGTIGGLEGEEAYKLTPSGRGFLSFQRLAVRR
jgi:hypothetical protein